MISDTLVRSLMLFLLIPICVYKIINFIYKYKRIIKASPSIRTNLSLKEFQKKLETSWNKDQNKKSGNRI